jgi:hypothetical protein
VSQFDNGRVLPFEILENKEAYNIPNDIRVELHCRKPDCNIVTLPSDSITNNIVTFLSTTQLTACYGKNICEIALYGPDDYLIGSCNFILDVEKSPTLGGINSTSAIHDLENQIRDIAEDVIPEILPDYLEDYYTKSEVDALIDNIFPTFTASGAIASFITALTKPLVSVITAERATTITRCGVNLFDKTADDATNGYKDNYYIAPDGAEQYSVSYAISEYIPLKGGVNITLTGAVGYNPSIAFYDLSKTLISASNYSGTNPCTKTTPNGTAFVRFSISKASIDTTQLEIGNQASSYHPYTGNTVPVAEATTLVTLSGVNNVFADVGEVTVGYKYMYMPIPESIDNSNRLLLSSVNSDIIKEKSEIKDQSDIIEDIERGDKNE